jgi:hypothetical protein
MLAIAACSFFAEFEAALRAARRLPSSILLKPFVAPSMPLRRPNFLKALPVMSLMLLLALHIARDSAVMQEIMYICNHS